VSQPLRVALLSRIVGGNAEAMAALKDAGIEVAIDLAGYQALGGDERRWLDVLSTVDGLLVGLQPVTAQQLAAAPKLRYILRIGTGTDNIAMAAATERGIVVESLPGLNAPAVAEYAFALLLAAAKRLGEADRSLRAGEWSRFTGRHLGGRTLGLIGYGEIAKAMVPKAHGFGMDVVVTRRGAATDEPGVRFVPLPELLATADFISVHVPLTDATRGLIGAAEFARMRDGVVLVNTARGAVVDETALHAALVGGKVGAAALDVFAAEPPPADLSLFDRPNVIVSPHNGGYSDLMTERTATTAAARLIAALNPSS
jgi:phosphoglycerate dehydrogenase-like enzyme